MRSIQWIFLPIVLAVGCARADRAAEAAADAEPKPAAVAEGVAIADPGEAMGWRELAVRVRGKTPAERFVSASALFLGTPYFNGPLGEGDGADVDPDPRVDFRRVDCVTYLEQALALALVDPRGNDADYLTMLDRIRYEAGTVDYVHRNHYMVRDWVPANAWLLRDVTAEVGGDAVRTLTRTIDRETFLRDAGATPRPGVDDARPIEQGVIPGEALAAVQARVLPGDLILWVGEVEGIFSLHTGLAVRDEAGTLLFRHGSSKAERVLDESFTGYAERRAKFVPYFVVLRLHDAVTAGGDLG